MILKDQFYLDPIIFSRNYSVYGAALRFVSEEI